MAKRRTVADQQRIQREVRDLIAKPRGEPMPAGSAVGFASAHKSNCCGAAVRVESDDREGAAFGVCTNHYVCTACGQPCDPV